MLASYPISIEDASRRINQVLFDAFDVASGSIKVEPAGSAGIPFSTSHIFTTTEPVANSSAEVNAIKINTILAGAGTAGGINVQTL